MDASRPAIGIASRLSVLATTLIVVAAGVSWLSYVATRQVSERTDVLVAKQIPQLGAIDALQDTLQRKVLSLYLYYATMDADHWVAGQQLDHEFEVQLKTFTSSAIDAGTLELATDIGHLRRHANLFQQEMDRGRRRDWDSLRAHLADAQIVADRLDRRLSGRAELIRAKVSDAGQHTRTEISQLNVMQVGFSAVLLLVLFATLRMFRGRMQDQVELYQRAFFDRLTGLPNRFKMELEWQADGGTRTLLLVKLDRYQMLTGTYGHGMVDQLIVLVARRLQNTIDIQGSPSRIYQFAPATWLLVVEEPADRSSSKLLAEMILGTSMKPLCLDDHEVTITSSIGVTYAPDHAVDVDAVLRNVDSALRASQLAGGARCTVYREDMHRQTERFLAVESAIRTGLHDNEFELHYQPKLDAEDLHCVGVEALIRWRRGGELVSPGEFIPVAEESGLIMPLGSWVIEEAARQWQVWSRAGLPAVPIAVNVSAQQFQAQGFVEQIALTLDRFDIPAMMLELEITEEATLGDPQTVIGALHALKATGVSIAIDDFGTGYSSLSYLKSFPIDVLKIDRAFVRDMDVSSRDLSIVTMIVMLGRKLGFKVVAEGVETTAQQEHLRAIGCDVLQGFLYSKPLPADEFASFLQEPRVEFPDRRGEPAASNGSLQP